WGGGKIGLSLADLCARRGRDVTVVEPSGVFGVELGLPGRFRLVHDLEERGVRLVADGSAEAIDADSFIAASGLVPRHGLLDALVAAGVSVRAVGDCAGVRLLEGAMADALDAASAIA